MADKVRFLKDLDTGDRFRMSDTDQDVWIIVSKSWSEDMQEWWISITMSNDEQDMEFAVENDRTVILES